MKKLHDILEERIDRMSYEDKTKKTRSGMTRLQEYLLRNGMREHRDGDKYDNEKYIAVKHPAMWTCDGYYHSNFSLLVPRELAAKMLTVGILP